MKCKLDWFSFTFLVRSVDAVQDDLTKEGVLSAFHMSSSGVFMGTVSAELWPLVEARGFYSNTIQDPITGMTIGWNGNSPYALVQCSGQVCDKLMERLGVNVISQAANRRATRIDLAVDMEVELSPVEFTACRNEGHFKTSGFYSSETGETCYVGSRSGERMARVYRYSPPHPRSHLLRAEVEYKGEAAKALCEALKSGSLTEVTLSAHLPFGWKHPVWNTDNVELSNIQARPYDKSNDGRWKWLMTVAWPALCTAHDEGVIDAAKMFRDWLDAYEPKD